MSTWLETGRTLAARLYRGSRQPRWVMASQMVTSGANFVTTLIVVISLGLGTFGQFSLCFILVMITRNFLVGLVLAPMSTIAPRLGRHALAGYRGFLAANAVAFSLGSSLALYALAAPLGMVLDAPWLPQLALAMALANFTANGADFLRRHHLVQDAPVRAFTVDAVRFAVQLGVLLVLYGGEGFSAQSALYALAVGGLAGCLAGLPRYGATRWSSRLARTVWPRHWNFIKWMMPGVLAETAQSHLPMIAATGFFGESALGLLRAVQSLANVLNLPLNALNQVLPVMASATYARNGVRELRRLIASSMRVSTALYLLITCLCIAAFPYLTSVFRFDRGPDALIVFVMFSLANYARTPAPADTRHGALFVGRLSPEKGVETLIRAWERLPMFPLTIAGSGPELERMRAFAPASVTFTGAQTPEEIALHMANAQALIVPSLWYEGFPMVVAEAFAAGLPVIASNIGSLAEIVVPGRNGAHFVPGDAEHLAATVKALLADPAALQRLAAGARASYEAHYTPETNLAQLERIYADAIEVAKAD